MLSSAQYSVTCAGRKNQKSSPITAAMAAPGSTERQEMSATVADREAAPQADDDAHDEILLRRSELSVTSIAAWCMPR